MRYYRNPDEDLRALERRFQMSPNDPEARAAYRNAIVRIGRQEEAGLRLGDRVRVFETEYQGTETIVVGPWVGVVIGVRLKNTQDFITDITTAPTFERIAIDDILVKWERMIGQSYWNVTPIWTHKDIARFQEEGLPLYLARDQVVLLDPV